MINLIVAMGKNRVIGKQNELPWHMPADLKHFKKTTLGHTIVMGRKTYESIGRPLPGRTNIVLSKTVHEIPGCTVVSNIEEVLELQKDQEVFVIGGEEIFKAFLPHAHRAFVTTVDVEVEDGDAFFPGLGYLWAPLFSEEHFKDHENPHDYKFLIYENYGRSRSV